MDFLTMKYTMRGRVILKSYDGWINKGQRVLGVGCGNGGIAKIIQNRFGCKIEGTDIMDFLEFKMPFRLMKSDEKLPYRDKSFDIVMLNDILHHTEKQVQILKESVRVGKNVLIFETKPTVVSKVLDFIFNWIHGYFGMSIPLTHKNLQQWQEIFRKLKVKEEYKVFSSPFPFGVYPLTHYSFRIKSK